MKESDLQRRILTYLRSNDAWCTKVVTATTSGVPDILCCYKGFFIGIEVKAPGKLKNVTELQQAVLDSITESGGIALAVDSMVTIRDLLEEIDEAITTSNRNCK